MRSSRKQKQDSSNLNFCKILMEEDQSIDKDISNQLLKQRIAAIMGKLGELTSEEKTEWKEIQISKLKQLHSRLAENNFRGDSKPLREGVRVFVTVASKIAIQYTQEIDKDIENMIKSTYKAKYGEKKTIQTFLRAGYKSNGREAVYYDQQEESISMWRVMCCCSTW